MEKVQSILLNYNFRKLNLFIITIAVISRQFHEMQRSRIEGLLASFPKLTSTGQQHTTVETEHVRFVYQPLDELFMVLITNRQVILNNKFNIKATLYSIY